jgi:RND family efflux transporter MFP subunit
MIRSDFATPVLAGSLLMILAGCHHIATEEVDTTDKVPVTVHAAERGSLHAVYSLTGVVRPASGAELVVTAPQSARITEISKAAGDRVRTGDVLVRFSIPALDSDAATKKADVSRAEARITTATATEQRLEGLFERGVAARKEVDDAKRELADAQTGLTEAKTARDAAGEMAARTLVRAPFAGIIASRGHNAGDLVDAGGDPILRLIDPARLEVEAQAPPAAAAVILPGMAAQVFGPSDAAEAAKVLTHAAALDAISGTAAFRLGFAQPTALPVGTPVRVEVAGSERANVVHVPAGAVVQEDADTFVFTVDAQNHAHRRAVKLGVASGGEVEIVSGLSAGEAVILTGQAGLPDGAAVTPTRS